MNRTSGHKLNDMNTD